MGTPEDRAWEMVRRAFDERTPGPQPRRHVKLAAALVAVVVAAVVGAALSSPGRAVFQRVREAVGVEHAAPAIVSLPGGGRLLVVSAEQGGVWVVEPDGLKRRLGTYADAQWSPHGLYLVATKGNELVALDPQGHVRWTLARLEPAAPRWEGTTTDTRIAYLAASGLRVVAGDGTGDHLLDAHAGDVPPAWDPARLHTLAYYTGGSIVLRRAAGPLVWRTPITVTPSALTWSTDGRYLAVVASSRVVVVDAHGRVRRTVSMLGGELRQAASERPQRGARGRRRPPRLRPAALRRPRDVRRRRVVAHRRLAARELAAGEPVGVHPRHARAGRREHPPGVPA
jgi:hypothetical protein